MKIIYKTLLVGAIISFGFIAQAQVNTKVNTKTNVYNKNVLGNKTNNAVKAAVSSNPSLGSLQNAKYTKKINTKELKSLNISKADLERTSRRSVKITPAKPNIPHLSISYYGSYSKDAFVLNHRPVSADGKSYKYSGFVKFNAVKGKEYRMKIALKSIDLVLRRAGAVRSGGTVLIELGGVEYQINLPEGQDEINFVFTADVAGANIGISPLQLPVSAKSINVPPPPGLSPLGYPPVVPTSRYNPDLSAYALTIKYIQIDEI